MEENSGRGSEAEGLPECSRTPFPKLLQMLRTIKKLVQGVRCNILHAVEPENEGEGRSFGGRHTVLSLCWASAASLGQKC